MKFKECDIVEVISTKKLKEDSANYVYQDNLKKGDIVMINSNSIKLKCYSLPVVNIVGHEYSHDENNFKLLKRMF